MSLTRNFPQFSPESIQLSKNHCEQLLSTVPGLTAAVLASADGFDVASAVRGRLKPERLAALASSIAAIGQVVALEGSLGHSQRIMIDGELGYVMVCSIDRQDIGLVLILLADNDALLGQLNVSARASSAFFKQIAVLAA
jgi:uncharacterized protein